MALDLSVPDRSTRLLAEAELNPGKVEKWLASLPLLNPAEGGRKLYSTLKTYNRIDLDADTRLELLELYRAPVQHVVTELQKQYVGLPLPLADKHKSAAEQNRDFHMELAYGYKYVVLARVQLPYATPRAMAAVALPLQRAIFHLTEVLLASYLSYSPCPPNLWREIHTLYLQAERLGITGLEVDDALNMGLRKGTVAGAYKRALLLDLGDPYHLPVRMIMKIYQYLECYADLATLHRNVARLEPNCHFLIDVEADRAGILYSNDAVLEPPERYCLLNTVELARRIHHQLKSLQNGEAPPCNNLPADFYRNGGQDMLLRLINVWGINPKRSFRRDSRPNRKVEVAIGLDAIAYALNGERTFVVSAELFGPFPQRTNIGVFAKAKDKTARSAEYERSAWDIRDESAGGMSLRKNGLLRRRVKVGDLVATRFGETNGWTIGAIRWVKSANSSVVEIGTQRLAPGASPVVVKFVTDESRESDFLLSLSLPAIPALKQPRTLVVARNVFRPKRVLYMDDGVRLHRLIAKELLEVTGGFERIAYDVDSPFQIDFGTL